jgi:hypothetical protein
MVKLKKCLAKSKGILSEEDENFLIKSEQDSQIGDDIQAANFAITQYYKKLHDQLNGLKQRVGLKAEPYPAFVLANESVPKQEYVPKPPSAKQLKAAKKALRFKEAEKALSLVAKYNALSRAAKRFGAGPAIYQALRDEVGRINADIFLARRGIKIVDKDGSIIKRPPTKSSADFISLKKDRQQILKDARNATPDTLEYAVIQDIVNGAVFSLKSFKMFTKLSGKELEAAPTYLINDNPGSKKLDIYTRNEDIFFQDEKASAEVIAETLENYFVPKAREKATSDLVAMYEKRFVEKGEQGLDKEQLKELDLLELENEELIKAVENIEAEIAEMAQKDLDSEEARKREEQDQIEQDRMEDELAAGMRFSKSGLPEDEGGISTAPPLAGIQQAVETDVKKQIEDFGVAKDQVGPVYSVISKVFQGIKDAGLTAARTVGDWVGIGKGEEKPYSLKIDGKDTQVKNVQVDVVNGFYSPLEKVIAETKQDKMPAKQWADKFGKGEEAKWTGLADWLAKQPGSVSKADIQQYLKENRVNVVEVVKGVVTGRPTDLKSLPDERALSYKGVSITNPFRDEQDFSDVDPVINYGFTEQQLSDAYKVPISKIQEWRRSVNGEIKNETKYSDFQLEGDSKNYKEVLVTLPNPENKGGLPEGYKIIKKEDYSDAWDGTLNYVIVDYDGYSVMQGDTESEALNKFNKLRKIIPPDKKTKFISSHFEEPNILVHLRMNTRKDSEGNNVLFLEEVQSDWGQKIKREGIGKKPESGERFRAEIEKYEGSKVDNIFIKDSMVFYTDVNGDYISAPINNNKVELEESGPIDPRGLDFLTSLATAKGMAGVPAAPFVMDTNAWTKLGLKVALKEAVAQGVDKIAWTTGEQQNKRYALSNQVDSINYKSNGDGTYLVYANKGDSILFKNKALPESQLEGSFGKDVAEKIINDKGQSKEGLATKVLEGDDLAVGGKGMKGFYGSPTEGTLGIVGNVAKSLFKQEPKITNLKSTKNSEEADLFNQFITRMADKYGEAGWVAKLNEVEKKEYQEVTIFKVPKQLLPQYSIDITPELKASVASGQALFKDAEAQYRIENGKNIIEAIKDFSGSPKAVVALTHEIMHPTVVTIIDGAKEGNEVGLKHTKTIVSEFNKATGENLTMDELIAGNDSFRDGKTTKQYRDVQEFIAESWEKYHTEGGKGFSSAFQQVLAQITEAFKAVYRSISGKEITPELRNFFDEILGKEQVAELNKQKQKESAIPGSFDKVYNAIKKALPKVNIILDDTIQGAGEVEGNTLRINPKYAGLDTPIHEAGHILIDAIGYKNKVVQAGINQLRKTDLWKDVESRYPELSDEMLGKEVLAEAIGREGANIFESESQKNKFMTVLSYLFDKFKRMLGLEKNVAKSLAKQIIGGMGTKGLVGTTAEIQMAKKREKRILTDAENQVKELVEAIGENDDLSNVPYEELVDVYNAINAQNIPGKSKYLRDIKTRIAMNIFEREKIKLENNKDFSAERAATKDIELKDVKFKVLSHFTNDFPIFKSLSEMWDAAYFNKVKEAREGKNTNEKLAIDVIKDRNSRLGITDRAINFVQSLFTNINYKYFSFLDNGKGKLVTLSEAKKKNYSKAQIEYLKFVRDLIASRKTLMESDDIYNMDMEVLKLDKGFSESFKTDGLTQAFGNWMTSSDGLRQTEIEFKNPLTGKTSITSYQNAETALVKYGEKGLKEKAESLALILKYNFAARRKKSDAENKKRGTYYLDENGQLKSKFDRSRPPEASYSTDFYKAVSEYIDDNAHITHISPLMPVIESIEYLNDKGVVEYDEDGNKKTIYAEKRNVVKWMKEWKDLHVLRQKAEGIPELDASLKFLRFLTSATTMMFNIPAGGFNILIGNYNAWRTGNTEMVTKGNARLFGGKKKFTSDYGYGIVNPIAVDIARKYNAVSTDVDSNPIQTVGGIMSKLGHAITKYGEFQIQASGLLGLMSDTDFNSFEYRKNKFGVDELVFKKDVTYDKQIEIEARILKHINTVSDIQGKYGEKDRRNIQNNELGKALMQFKVYLPDYWRMRYGKDVGSWNIMVNGGLKQLKADIKKNGFKKGLWDNQSKEAKAFMSNLKGTAAVALFMILSHSDDDDDEGAVEFAEKMLSNLLGVFDPVQLKFTITRPIAAMGVVDRFLTAVEHLALWSDDAYMKSTSKYGEKGDAKILNDIKGLVPARKAADVIDMFSEDEE